MKREMGKRERYKGKEGETEKEKQRGLKLL